MDSIRILRVRAGWSQRELAERLGVDRTAIVKYESGNGEPSLRLAVRMADLFAVSMDELLGRRTPDPGTAPRPENPLLHSGRAAEPAARADSAASARYDTASAVRADSASAARTRTEPSPRPEAQPAQTAPAPLPEDGDPQLLLMLHELRAMTPAARQRVSDFMSGMRAQRDSERA